MVQDLQMKSCDETLPGLKDSPAQFADGLMK
jgi:hypothetical protein